MICICLIRFGDGPAPGASEHFNIQNNIIILRILRSLVALFIICIACSFHVILKSKRSPRHFIVVAGAISVLLNLSLYSLIELNKYLVKIMNLVFSGEILKLRF